jgi:DNA-cytosine methyltransferase
MSFNVLSLFDGMSCGQIALNKANVPYDNYYASEIDEHAINVTQNNYPKTVQLGDVTKINSENLPKIDLLNGGSPCQGFSMAGKQLNFNDPRSKLFFEFVRLLKELKPKWFLLENVRMKKEYKDVITEHLQCAPVYIDSADFSACHRRRLYWTNIPIERPWLKNYDGVGDVLDIENDLNKITLRYNKKKNGTLSFQKSRSQTINICEKHRCLTTSGQGISNSGATNISIDGEYYNINSSGAEKMHTIPIGYTRFANESQRHRMIGNGWTIDVISHIFKGLKEVNINNDFLSLFD